MPLGEPRQRVGASELLPRDPAEDDREAADCRGVEHVEERFEELELAGLVVDALRAAAREDCLRGLGVADDLEVPLPEASAVPLDEDPHRVGVAEELAQRARLAPLALGERADDALNRRRAVGGEVEEQGCGDTVAESEASASRRKSGRTVWAVSGMRGRCSRQPAQSSISARARSDTGTNMP